jgi:hypothetical protein
MHRIGDNGVRMRRVFVCSALAIAASGCGNDRTEAPDVAVVGPFQGTVAVRYPQQGIGFNAPKGWDLNGGKSPLVATAQTGQATIVVWRYPRTEPLPKTKAQVQQARDSLLAAAKARDPTFKPIKVSIIRVGKAPAVQIRATETIAGHPRVVRSTHIYTQASEVIVDAYAPSDVFKRVDATAFRAVLRTLRISEPQQK